MINLSVNINKIATLRNSRGGNIPDILYYSSLILKAGAQGLTVHPRSDQRHITTEDVFSVKSFLTQYNYTNEKHIEYNIEGDPGPRYLDLVLRAVPDQATLVPVVSGEITSHKGFVLETDYQTIAPIIKLIKDKNIRVSIFVEYGVKNLSIAKDIGVDRIELYTGPFAEAYSQNIELAKELFLRYEETALQAIELGLEINAGHDLDQYNLQTFRNLSGLKEVSIGHRLISHSLEVGLANSVSSYLQILS
jgi:pyridoxine 5-phosphate synthase